MPQIEVNEEQVLRALDQLSPTARRTALAKLIRGYDALDRLVERNRERVEAMKEIWTKDEAEYHGEFVNFDPIWAWPKPVTKPHPPVLMGGDGPRTLQRVVEFADGWMPIGSRGGTERLAGRITELQQMAKAAGRERIPVTTFGAAPDPQAITKLGEIGVDRVLFGLRSAPAEEVLPALKQYAEVVKSL